MQLTILGGGGFRVPLVYGALLTDHHQRRVDEVVLYDSDPTRLRAIEGVLAIYSIARIGQVQVIHRARLATPDFSPGEETLETRLFAWDAIPWDQIAFPSVHWALHAWHDGRDAPLGVPATNPPADPRGIRPLSYGA